MKGFSLAWLSICACLTQQVAYAETDMPGSVIAVQGGRYAFGQVSPYARHQYLLDTQTGKLWRFVCTKTDKDSKECLSNALDPIPFLNLEGDIVSIAPDPSKK